MSRPDSVAVVGAGAVGLTVAHDLAERDVPVTVFEAGDAVAAGSSGRAAGVCYDAYTEATDAALGQRAIERFREFSGAGGFRFEGCPYVWWVREPRPDDDPSALRVEQRATALREGVERMQAHGLDVALVSPDALADEFPALRTADIGAAAIARNAGHTDPGSYVRMLAESAPVREGVDLRPDTPVEVHPGPEVATPDGREAFDAVVVAAGAHTRQVVAPVAPIAMKPYRVQALTTEPTPMRGGLPMGYDATAGYYFRPHHDGGLLVGDGTVPEERDPDDWTREADDWFVEGCAGYLTAAVGRSLPVARAWAGLCTATPDGHPLCGELAPGIYVGTGWQGHGFMRAPATGELLAGMVCGEREGPAHFAPTRFDGDEDFPIVEGMDVEARLD